MSDDNKKIPDQDLKDIMSYIPHRYPFLMLDKVIDIHTYRHATGVKCVTVNEPHFQGHFPHEPIMPGIFIIEAMAQTSAVLIGASIDLRAANKLIYFVSLDKTKFRKPVVPGDVLKLHVTHEHNRSGIWAFIGKAMVDDTLVAESRFKATVRDFK